MFSTGYTNETLVLQMSKCTQATEKTALLRSRYSSFLKVKEQKERGREINLCYNFYNRRVLSKTNKQTKTKDKTKQTTTTMKFHVS